MTGFDLEKLISHLGHVLEENCSPEGYSWLKTESKTIRESGDIRKFNTAFVIIPRKTGKEPLLVSGEAEAELQKIRTGLVIREWSTDQLARVWLLLHLPSDDQNLYVSTIENLFRNAEMNELIALYSALPVLAWPESWRKRCAEGIRSNIGQVLETIMCLNPYPAEQLDESAWNQLVLKAIFTEKPLLSIYQLRERSNFSLARSISEFAHERWAAHRQVNPMVWYCIPDFVDEAIFVDLERLSLSTSLPERHSAALVCIETKYGPAKTLLEKNPMLKSAAESGNLTWKSVAEEWQNALSVK